MKAVRVQVEQGCMDQSRKTVPTAPSMQWPLDACLTACTDDRTRARTTEVRCAWSMRTMAEAIVRCAYPKSSDGAMDGEATKSIGNTKVCADTGRKREAEEGRSTTPRKKDGPVEAVFVGVCLQWRRAFVSRGTKSCTLAPRYLSLSSPSPILLPPFAPVRPRLCHFESCGHDDHRPSFLPARFPPVYDMQSDAAEAALGLLGLTGAFPSPSTTTTPTVPAKRKQPPPRQDSPSSRDGQDSQSSDSISCICGFTYDDGFSIGCDSCARWCHAACFSIVENQVPDEWYCWVCEPRPVDRDRAVKLQKARQRQAVAQANANAPPNGRRRSSPGVERKTRKPTALSSATDGVPHPNDKTAHGNKRKRRASTTVNAASHHHPHPQEDEHVDIDEPWTHSYVPITKDIIPGDETRDRLRRVASDWRGVSAINPNPSPSSSSSSPHTPGCTTPALLTPDDLPYASPASLCPPQISIAHLHGAAAGTAWPGLFSNGSGNSVRPPSYAVHATQPIQSSKLIAPYPSTIIPTAMYLRDPLNAYAHLGMPKPYVHLFGPPLDVALDARITGDQSRFVRSGCRPNAILRPMFCGSQGKKAGKNERDEDEAITFGIFALRDLKANEEVVLGWEWDDDNVVHHLPALLQSPFAFPYVAPSSVYIYCALTSRVRLPAHINCNIFVAR